MEPHDALDLPCGGGLVDGGGSKSFRTSSLETNMGRVLGKMLLCESSSSSSTETRRSTPAAVCEHDEDLLLMQKWREDDWALDAPWSPTNSQV